jgi:hypothetical protein
MTRFENRSRVIDAFLTGDGEGLAAAIPDGVTFHSPMQDYAGRRRAERVLRALTGVLGHQRMIASHTGTEETVVRFAGELDGREAEGVLIVGDVDITLFIRPLPVLLAGIERMKAVLG